MESQQSQNSKSIQVWDGILNTVLSMPGARVPRDSFLRKELSKYYDEITVNNSIETSPSQAGISPEIIKKVSNNIISNHRYGVTSLSAAAGFPGGWWAAGTIPADISQFFWHIVVISQKLAYLHGWPDSSNDRETDEGTKGVLTLFIGVMFGVNAANKGIAMLASQIGTHAAQRIPKQALTKTVWYPIAKSVASNIGYKLTKYKAGQIIGKSIPVLGAVISGSMSWVSFGTMSNRLKNHLEGLYMHTRKEEALRTKQDNAKGKDKPSP